MKQRRILLKQRLLDCFGESTALIAEQYSRCNLRTVSLVSLSYISAQKISSLLLLTAACVCVTYLHHGLGIKQGRGMGKAVLLIFPFFPYQEVPVFAQLGRVAPGLPRSPAEVAPGCSGGTKGSSQ